MKWRYITVSEDGDVFGTNAEEEADEAAENNVLVYDCLEGIMIPGGESVGPFPIAEDPDEDEEKEG